MSHRRSEQHPASRGKESFPGIVQLYNVSTCYPLTPNVLPSTSPNHPENHPHPETHLTDLNLSHDCHDCHVASITFHLRNHIKLSAAIPRRCWATPCHQSPGSDLWPATVHLRSSTPAVINKALDLQKKYEFGASNPTRRKIQKTFSGCWCLEASKESLKPIIQFSLITCNACCLQHLHIFLTSMSYPPVKKDRHWHSPGLED